MWPVDGIGGLNIQRPPTQGKRVWLTDAEYKAVSDRMEKSRNAAAAETKNNKLGMGQLGGNDRRAPPQLDDL